MLKDFDLVIIGGGPAGYTAAIRAAQLGMKVACVEKNVTLGGTCLNVGCIPSKALLYYSEKYYDAKNHFSDYGIEVNPLLQLDKMMAKKNKVVKDLQGGIASLFAKNKVISFTGFGVIKNANTVLVKNSNGDTDLTAKNILIATGSKVSKIEGINYDEKDIVSSTGALAFEKVPESLIVIGAGYIGLELGSVWSRLGSKVRVIEYGDKILPSMDKELASLMEKTLVKQGMSFTFNTKLVNIEKKSSSLIAHCKQKDSNLIFETEKILIAVGRLPLTDNLGLEELKIAKDNQGRISVNSKYQTTVSNIYAVGDVIAGPMLAHKAEEEAISAVNAMNNKVSLVHYNNIPSVIYTNPEVASVGATEEELKAKGVKYKVGKMPVSANSRARATDSTNGLVKILTDEVSDEILGAHIMATNAGDLINEITLGMSFRASAEDIFAICHPHPTISEAVKEACLNVHNRSINI